VPPDNTQQHELYMQQCLELAKRASYMGEVPVGAVIVKQGIVLATASNAQIGMCDPTAHAEVIALRDAAKVQENYRLSGCTVYSTVEPCLMCAGALLHARVDKVVYGAAEPRAGAVTGSVDYFDEMR